MGDLLPWFKKPCEDDALRAYIIRICVRDASNVLLARPYSPHLFKQGVAAIRNVSLSLLQGAPSLGKGPGEGIGEVPGVSAGIRALKKIEKFEHLCLFFLKILDF